MKQRFMFYTEAMDLAFNERVIQMQHTIDRLMMEKEDLLAKEVRQQEMKNEMQ